MKTFIFALIVSGVVLAQTLPAYASCTTHTYFINGRSVICTTCCYGSFCNTTCN